MPSRAGVLVTVACAAVLAAAPAGAASEAGGKVRMNAINVIAPYRHDGMWVFDDPRVGLVKEPFVAGADTMIDRAVAGIPDAGEGFLLLFSATPFPGHRLHLAWRRHEGGGDWYWEAALGVEGWLCPALLRYFDAAPHDIYVDVRPKPPRAARP